jgi:hypothetical protein
MIDSVRDAAVAPADVFRLYADPSTWSRWGQSERAAGDEAARHIEARSDGKGRLGR